ncbi:MAG: ABC transporter substrate-binding protein, partial [Chloroflexota bacterium]
MSKKVFWLVVSGLMVISLVMAACAPAATPTTPTPAPATPTTPTAPTTPTTPAQERPQKEAVSPEAPNYGGTLTLAQNTDVTLWDPSRNITGLTMSLIQQELFQGDWAKGPAGGYGTSETDWGAAANDLFDLKTGYLANGWKWTVDEAKGQGTIIFQIRPGVRWALNPKSEASRLVAGREVTADDVVFSLKRGATWELAFIYGFYREFRAVDITKTGPREVTIKVPLDNLVTAVSRFSNAIYIVPPEVVTKYGDMNNWRNAQGTGPFMLADYVPASQIVFARNPNYWDRDPVGPGKGNQLPYLDGVRILILPDASTRLAALRTGKVDQMTGVSMEDSVQLRKNAQALLERIYVSTDGRGTPLAMRLDKPELPFKDIRVRRAMMMAIDFQGIRNSLYGGVGQIVTFPYSSVKEYERLYVGLDDPDFPESARELYSYNPEKAKQLLKEAGYPNGFKTSMVLTSTEVDYYSIIKDMWAK